MPTRDIRRRIRSVSGTAQITKAMQMVAASKMRKAQQAALAAAPFARLLYRIQRQRDDSRRSTSRIRCWRCARSAQRAVILIAADKGLCGALNSNVFRLAAQFDPASTVFIAAGRKAAQFVARTRPAAGRRVRLRRYAAFRRGAGDRRVRPRSVPRRRGRPGAIVATRFVNTLTQEPVPCEYLPVGEITGLKIPGAEPRGGADRRHGGDAVRTERRGACSSYLLRTISTSIVYQVLLEREGQRAERAHGGDEERDRQRRELIKDLTLEYNKLRQGNITKELLEIAGGQADERRHARHRNRLHA